MTRLTISTDIPEDLERIKRIIAGCFRIVRVKGPQISKDSGRLNYYIFLGECRRPVNNPS